LTANSRTILGAQGRLATLTHGKCTETQNKNQVATLHLLLNLVYGACGAMWSCWKSVYSRTPVVTLAIWASFEIRH